MSEATFVNLHRPDQAVKKLCPQPEIKHCVAADCMAWRFADLVCTPEWAAAVKKRAEETNDRVPFAKSARWVNENREVAGLPLKPFNGYCGLAGPV